MAGRQTNWKSQCLGYKRLLDTGCTRRNLTHRRTSRLRRRYRLCLTWSPHSLRMNQQRTECRSTRTKTS